MHEHYGAPLPLYVPPPSADSWLELDRRLSGLEQRLAAYETAFILDDLNRPGFDEHRRDHRVLRAANQSMEGYKQEGAKTILKAVIGAILALLLLGVGEFLRSGRSG